jgi:hypothetical protein
MCWWKSTIVGCYSAKSERQNAVRFRETKVYDYDFWHKRAVTAGSIPAALDVILLSQSAKMRFDSVKSKF